MQGCPDTLFSTLIWYRYFHLEISRYQYEPDISRQQMMQTVIIYVVAALSDITKTETLVSPPAVLDCEPHLYRAEEPDIENLLVV